MCLPIPSNKELRKLQAIVAKRIKPHDTVPPRFEAAYDFHRYRLRNTNPGHHASHIGKDRPKINMEPTDICTFNVKNPGAIQELLNDFCSVYDENRITEGKDTTIISDCMTGDAKEHYLYRLMPKDDVMTNYYRSPLLFEMVTRLLKTYARETPFAIPNPA